MRYIKKEELESLEAYSLIEKALYFGTNRQSKANWPYTAGKPSYVAVRAIYNLLAWSSWKSSSLSDSERALADAISELKLYKIAELNKGRRMNQPALFPEGDLLPAGKGVRW